MVWFLFLTIYLLFIFENVKKVNKKDIFKTTFNHWPVTFILFSCILSNRYLLVECNEGKETKEGAMYLNVMRRFSQALMKVGVSQMKN